MNGGFGSVDGGSVGWIGGVGGGVGWIGGVGGGVGWLGGVCDDGGGVCLDLGNDRGY